MMAWNLDGTHQTPPLLPFLGLGSMHPQAHAVLA